MDFLYKDQTMSLKSSLVALKLDTVEGAFAYSGGENLHKQGLGHRQRTRLNLSDSQGNTHVLYLKRYHLATKFWNCLFSFQSPARIEYDNINAARACGIATMETVSWGENGNRSYLIVTAVPGEALERCMERFLHLHGSDAKIHKFTCNLATLVRTLHQSGYVHRDLYACHIFLDDTRQEPKLYLIDLARMFVPLWHKFRWYVKDLAQLKYSMPQAWVSNFWDIFLAQYLSDEQLIGKFQRAVDRKVDFIRRQVERRKLRPCFLNL